MTMLGHKQSDETRAKIGAARLGKKRAPFSAEWRNALSAAKKGNTFRLGHKHSLETRAKMSASAKGQKKSLETRARMSIAQKGSGNHEWRGGISRAPYAWSFGAELKEEVRRRDGHKCQLCGTPQAECKNHLDIHHVDYDKKNSDPVNLTALCRSCHMRTNSNRYYWKTFFQSRSKVNAEQGLLF